MENDTYSNYLLKQLNAALANSSLRGMLGRNTVKYSQKVAHLDVVAFDIYGYWGDARELRPEEDTSRVLCYALYSPDNKEVLLHSFPGSEHRFADNLTKAMAPFCEVLGSLADDDELRAELKSLMRG